MKIGELLALKTHANVKLLVPDTLQSTSQKMANMASNLEMPATNLVQNGDFSNGAYGWLGIDNIVDGVAEKTNTTRYNAISANLANPVLLRTHLLYLAADVKADNSAIKLQINDSYTTPVSHSGGGAFERLSVMRVIAPDTVAISVRVQDNRSSGWTKYYVDNAVVLDLTEIFGAGNEPPQAQMDALLRLYPNSWFDGTVNFAKSVVLVPYFLKELNRLSNPVTPA